MKEWIQVLLRALEELEGTIAALQERRHRLRQELKRLLDEQR